MDTATTEPPAGATRRGRPDRAVAVPVAGAALVAATVVWGVTATALGTDLGTASPPLLYRLDPEVAPTALLAVGVTAAAVLAGPRLCRSSLSPAWFALGALGLALGLRLGLGLVRDGVPGWWAVYELGNVEAASEYLPALGALDLGARTFLDTFAEVGPSLTVNAVGHPPGLLLTLHGLGIETPEAMAALTIGVGALSVPLAYLLARRLLDEGRARAATLLYAFAPSAVMHGVTSADALYATLALLACLALLARAPARARLLGPAALALASFFSYANLAVGAFATLVAWRRDGLGRAASLALAAGAGLLASYALFHLATGYDPIGAVRSAESVYREGVASNRPYAFWVLGAPAAFLIAAGLPVAWYALRSLGRGETVAVALFAVLGVAAVLGFTKAETERIYLFLVPLLCIAAASALPARRLGPVLVALALQALALDLLFFTVW